MNVEIAAGRYQKHSNIATSTVDHSLNLIEVLAKQE